MTQHYSNPERANEVGALPDAETFYVSATDDRTGKHPFCPSCTEIPRTGYRRQQYEIHNSEHVGWYYDPTPGNPVGEFVGPFTTEAEAVADARDGIVQDDDDGVTQYVVGDDGRLCIGCKCHRVPWNQGSDYCDECQAKRNERRLTTSRTMFNRHDEYAEAHADAADDDTDMDDNDDTHTNDAGCWCGGGCDSLNT